MLLQKFPAETFTATTKVTMVSKEDGQEGGLIVMGWDYAALTVRREHTVVLITHDNSIAVQAERIIRLEDGQVVYDGDAHAPEAVVQPTLSGKAAQEEAK